MTEIEGADSKIVKLRINSELKRIRNQLKAVGMDGPLFCVVDEAQVTTETHMDAFSSNKGHPRPILRELLEAWIVRGPKDLYIESVEPGSPTRW